MVTGAARAWEGGGPWGGTRRGSCLDGTGGRDLLTLLQALGKHVPGLGFASEAMLAYMWINGDVVYWGMTGGGRTLGWRTKAASGEVEVGAGGPRHTPLYRVGKGLAL